MQKLLPPLAILLLWAPANAEDLPSTHAERMKAGTALFQDTIRPALMTHCVKCHGDEKVRSGLDLSSRDLLLEGGESEDAIDLENPANSYLLKLIRHEEEEKMPPKKDKLSEALIADFER
jgi:mono/diheme cytochrome c family protein